VATHHDARRPGRCLVIALAGLVLVAVSSGCQPAIPRIEFANRRYSAALRTATNTRSVPRLTRVREMIERDREAGTIAPDEYAAYMAIVTVAERGDWERAEQQTLAFRRAQRPTGWW
jgi:hypothetical protein